VGKVENRFVKLFGTEQDKELLKHTSVHPSQRSRIHKHTARARHASSVQYFNLISIFYHSSLLSSLIVCVANIISLIYPFTCSKISYFMLLNYSLAGAPVHELLLIEYGICIFTLLLILFVNVQHWCHEKLLLMVRLMVLVATSLLSSVVLVLSLSVYVTYSGIGNVNSWLFSLWFEWSIVYHIFLMMSSVFWYPSSWGLLLLLYIWIDAFFYVIHCMHS